MTEIIDLIVAIDVLHQYFNQDICNDFSSGINFRKKQVNHLFENTNLKTTFFNHLDKYYPTLRNFIQSDRFVDLEDQAQIEIRSRIKERESLVSKLNRYYEGDEKGKMPLQKCVNDILGLRVITSVNLMMSQEFFEVCEKLKQQQIIYFFYPRHVGDYKGLHLYFKGKSNNYLPWELQIWYNEHEEMNMLSHAKYKQHYFK